jgi:hypothetical protein
MKMSTTPSLVKRHPLATLLFLVGALAWLLEDRAWAVGGWTGLHGSADAGSTPC